MCRVDQMQLSDAKLQLSRFVLVQAARARQRHGFGWIPDPSAPTIFSDLLAAFTRSMKTGHPLPVARISGGPSIFVSAEATYAMRFWHDITHVEMGADFSFENEQRVASAHMDLLERSGFRAGTLPWELMRIDTVGRSLVFTLTGGGFAPDPWVFAQRALSAGLPLAVLRAVEDIKRRPVRSEDIVQLGTLLELT